MTRILYGLEIIVDKAEENVAPRELTRTEYDHRGNPTIFHEEYGSAIKNIAFNKADHEKALHAVKLLKVAGFHKEVPDFGIKLDDGIYWLAIKLGDYETIDPLILKLDEKAKEVPNE